MKITDGHSGKKKFFKGRGRKGNTKLDDYQKMLLDSENKDFQNDPNEIFQKKPKKRINK